MHSRRQILRWCAAVSFIGTSGNAAALGLQAWPVWSSLDHLADFVALGRHCLKYLTKLHLASTYQLTEDLNRRLQIGSDKGVGTRRINLGMSVCRDFCRGEVLVVDGWCLSTTEVLLAVLAYRTFGSSDETMEDGA